MTQKYIGAPIRRKEDVRFLTGSAQYIDDVAETGGLGPGCAPLEIANY